jgi:hypothetical protein
LNIADLAATADVTFEVRERVTLPVDDRTPRIVPATFIGGKRPVGVLDMSYVIDVAGLLDCALSAETYIDLMRTIGSGASV